jgi:hypothetical protein
VYNLPSQENNRSEQAMNTQTDLVKEISEIAAAMPAMRRRQLYEFALFLESHPLPAEETLEAIAADEAQWEAQFAATDEDKLAALVASVESEIKEGKTSPMFDENGEFIEHK